LFNIETRTALDRPHTFDNHQNADGDMDHNLDPGAGSLPEATGVFLTFELSCPRADTYIETKIRTA